MLKLDRLAVLTVFAVFSLASATYARADSFTLSGVASSVGETGAQKVASASLAPAPVAAPTPSNLPTLFDQTAADYTAAHGGDFNKPILTLPTTGEATGSDSVSLALSAAAGTITSATAAPVANAVNNVLLKTTVDASPLAAHLMTHCADGPCAGSSPVVFTGTTIHTTSGTGLYTFAVLPQSFNLTTASTSSDPVFVTNPNVPGASLTNQIVAAIAPEPDSLVLLGTGMFGVAFLLLRRRRDARAAAREDLQSIPRDAASSLQLSGEKFQDTHPQVFPSSFQPDPAPLP